MKDLAKKRERLVEAEARVELCTDLEAGMILINKFCKFPSGTAERRHAKLIQDAVFYVMARQLDGFRDFLDEIQAVDSGTIKKGRRREVGPGRTKAKRAMT